MEETHCIDCCCAQSWKALGITTYDGKSIVEHIAEIKAQRDELADKLNAILFYMPEDWRNDEKAFPAGLIPEAMALIKKLKRKGK